MSKPNERDEELSRLYSEAPHAEPPPRVDAAILAVARAAARPVRRPQRPWWLRWAVPVSVATVALLSASLTLLVSREQDRLEPASPAAVVAPPAVSVPAPGQEVASDRRGLPVPGSNRGTGSPSAVLEPPSIETRQNAVPRQREAARKVSPGEAGPATEAASREQALPAIAPGAATQAFPAPAAGEATRDAAAPDPASALSAESEARPRPAPAFPAAPAKSDALRYGADDAGGVATRIERIRRMLRQGKDAEALAELQTLRRSHPDLALPPELEALERR